MGFRSRFSQWIKQPMKSRLFSLLFLLVTTATSASAAEDATWDVIQHNILGQNCAGCHSTGTPFAAQSGLLLTENEAYRQLIDRLPKNTAAQADGLLRVSSAGGAAGVAQSFLWEKINAPAQEHFYADHPAYGSTMPLGGLPLTNGELEFVKRWIYEGAPQTGSVVDIAVLDDTTRYVAPEFAPLDPPERGIQFHLGPFDVWPSEINDREFLYFEPFETTEDLFISRYEILFRPGSHHFILYNYPEGVATPEAGYRDIRNQAGFPNFEALLELNALFPFQFFVGSQSPLVDYRLPEGVALRLPAGSGFDLNSHSVNRTGTTQTGEVYVNLHTVDRDEIEHVADYANFGNYDIALPPQQETTISKTFTFDETRQVIQIWSHSHEHTDWFRIERVGGERDGELIYWNNDWEHPSLLQLDTPITFEEGDQIRLVTQYTNNTDETIRFGPLSTDEMQFMFYIYYTGDISPPDLLSDLTGNGFVDFEDLTVLLANWNKEVGADAGNLVNPTTTPVNFEDLTVLLADWTGPGPAGSPEAALGDNAVPEPSTLLLALLATLGLSFYPRRRRQAF